MRTHFIVFQFIVKEFDMIITGTFTLVTYAHVYLLSFTYVFRICGVTNIDPIRFFFFLKIKLSFANWGGTWNFK